MSSHWAPFFFLVFSYYLVLVTDYKDTIVFFLSCGLMISLFFFLYLWMIFLFILNFLNLEKLLCKVILKIPFPRLLIIFSCIQVTKIHILTNKIECNSGKLIALYVFLSTILFLIMCNTE